MVSDNPSSTSFKSLQDLVASRSFERDLKVSDALEFPEFREAGVVGGRGGCARVVRHVNVMQIPTAKFAKVDQLIIAAEYAVADRRVNQAGLVMSLADAGVSALAVRQSTSESIFDEEAIDQADRLDLPLIELPPSVHLADLQSKILEHIIMHREVQLRVASQTLHSLARHAASDRPLQLLVKDMKRLIGASVSVFNSHGTIAATTLRPDEATLSLVTAWLAQRRNDPVEIGTRHILWPILAGTRRLGCLTAAVGGIQDGVTLAALEHGATIAAMHMLHIEEAAEMGRRLKSKFLRELLSGILDHRSAHHRASALGWDANGAYFAMVARSPEVDRAAFADCLSRITVGSLLTDEGISTVALIPKRTEVSVDSVASSLGAHLPEIYAGTSREHVGLESIPLAVHEARSALAAAERFGRRTRLRNFGSLGAMLLLKDVPVEDLRRFEREVFRPIDALEPDYGTILLQTLELLIETNLNLAETARRGGWHYNTVRHRVLRLRELLGPFTEDGSKLDSISVALLVRHELVDSTHGSSESRSFQLEVNADA